MEKLKVVLIEPPLPIEKEAGSLKEVANILPSLNLGYLAAVLEKNGFNVEIIDARVLNLNNVQLLERLKQDKPNLIGITSTVLTINTVIELCKSIKKELKGSLVVIGGPHISSTPKETMKFGCFDIGVIGEGEYTLLEIVQQLSIGKLDLKKIRGICYIKNKKLIFNEARDYIKDLDELPFPARHLYPPLSEYHPVPASYKKLPLAHMFTSRGCPHQCTFCDRTTFGKRFRARSPKNVVDEIEECLTKYHAKEIKFFDDAFTVDKKRTTEICNEIIKRGLKFPWSCLTRVDNVSLELLEKMKEAGCWQVSYGLESGSQRILDLMKKGITIEQSRNAVNWAKKAKLNVRAFFILGFPGETLETINETIRFAKELRIDVASFYTITPYPGNEMFQMIKDEGKLRHMNYDDYVPLIDINSTKLAYVPDGITEEQLKRSVSRAYKEFFLRPSYIFRQIFSIRSLEDIKRYWKGFKAIIST